MRDEIYVGKLISEDALAHSSGLWKKHKYIKKIGDRYYYTKEQLKSAGRDVKDVVSTLKDARETIKERKEIDRVLRTGSSDRQSVVETVKDTAYKRSGLKDRDDAKTYGKVAKMFERRASSRDASDSARADAKKNADAYRKSESAAKERYNKSLIGKAENGYHSTKERLKNAGEKVSEVVKTRDQSKHERTSLKGRSERAKKRLEQALKRTRRKK